MLRWYANRDDRRRVMRQLNKGESLHDLRAYLMIANKGYVRRNRSEDLANQASCLNLVEHRLHGGSSGARDYDRCGEPSAGFLNNQNCSITIGNPDSGSRSPCAAGRRTPAPSPGVSRPRVSRGVRCNAKSTDAGP